MKNPSNAVVRTLALLTLSAGSAHVFANDFVATVAYSDSTGSTPYDFYRTTALGLEVDELDDPSGGGFEYWPYVWNEASGTHPHPYPDSIQWGFSSGGDVAQKCMKLSWHIWNYIQEHPPENLLALQLVDGAPSSYFHWNNDYTQARRENLGYKAFWHYNRPNGLIKWISHTKIDGTCEHPTVEAIDLWARCEIKRLTNSADQCSGHR